MRRTPLDSWIEAAIGARPTPAAVWEHQRGLLQRTLAWAKEHSVFYARHLLVIDPAAIHSPEDLAGIPTTSPEELRGRDHEFLCVSQGDIARVVTLGSSGTTGASKRVHFTGEDLERTVDFFQHGMSSFTKEGDAVLILMPGERPGSVGDLLRSALERIGARGFVHGPVTDPAEALETLRRVSPQVVVGIPVHVLTLSGRDQAGGQSVRSVLLCSDNVPRSLARTVEQAWSCRVFTHWGMTETGLGGGVECEARDGYHLREADLYVEVVDPSAGTPLPQGREGEVAITTLTRQGMPLIRYRTGDLAAFQTKPCPCGSLLRRLGRITGRTSGQVKLASGQSLSLPELDEVLFGLHGVEDYQAQLLDKPSGAILEVRLQLFPAAEVGVPGKVRQSLKRLLKDKNIPENELTPAVLVADQRNLAGLAKRSINGQRHI